MTDPAGRNIYRRLAAIFAADVEGYSRLMGLERSEPCGPSRLIGRSWTN
jgi:hypothetical protein